MQDELQRSRERSKHSAPGCFRRGDNHFSEFRVTEISEVICHDQLGTKVLRTVQQPIGFSQSQYEQKDPRRRIPTTYIAA